MQDAGWTFCRDCPQFGTLMGGMCGYTRDGADRPACWYQGRKPASSDAVLASWIAWIKKHGAEKQTAPYGLDDEMPIEVRVAPVPDEAWNQMRRRDAWEPNQYLPPSSLGHQRGYRDLGKEPLKLDCSGSDWPQYCEAHK
jgi:hypothetical protein